MTDLGMNLKSFNKLLSYLFTFVLMAPPLTASFYTGFTSSPSKFKLYCLDLLFGNGKLTRSFVFKLNPDPFRTRTRIHSRPEPFYDPKPKEKYGMGRVFDPKTKMVSTRGLYGSTPFFSKYFVIFFSLVCFFFFFFNS